MNPQYEHPPIREAVCEFRFRPDSPWDLAIPGLFYTALRDEFPRRLQNQTGVAATIPLVPDVAQPQIQQVTSAHELRFWRESDDGMIRLRPHILSVSHYEPYPSWHVFYRVIERVLGTYLEIAQPVGVQRIGLRYINNFDFTGAGRVDLEDFFDFYPFLGSRMTQELSSFVVGVQYDFDNDRDALRVQMQPISEGRPETRLTRHITLDLDYFLVKPDEVAVEGISDWLQTAHDRLRDTFEGCLKDELRTRLGKART